MFVGKHGPRPERIASAFPIVLGSATILIATYFSVTTARLLGAGVSQIASSADAQMFRRTFGIMAISMTMWVLSDLVGRRILEWGLWSCGNRRCGERARTITECDHRFGESFGPASFYASVDEDEAFVIRSVSLLIPAVLSLLGLLTFGYVVISRDVATVAFVYAFGIVLAVCSMAITGPRAVAAGRQLRDAESLLGQIEREWFSVGPEIASGAGERILRTRHADGGRDAVRCAKDSARAAMSVLATCSTIIAITEAIAVVLSIYYVVNERAPVGLAATTWQCAQMTREPLNQLMWGLPEISKGMGAARRIREVTRRTTDNRLVGGVCWPTPEGGICVQDVYLRPSIDAGAGAIPTSDDLDMLGPFNLDVGLGEVVCLVGRSGVGKSSLVNAIAGMRPAERGTITVGGYRYDQVARQWWMERVIGVSQRMVLGESAPLTSDAVAIAVEEAMAVGPSALLLDEPTTNMDSMEARRFIAHLKREAAHRNVAVVVISHRPETIDMCDRKVSVDDNTGRIAE